MLRATAILGTSSVVTLVTGVATAKLLAVWIGPVGIGKLGLLQSMVSLLGIVVGSGVGVGIVRLGASSASAPDKQRLLTLRQAASAIVLLVGLALATCTVLFRHALSNLFLGSQSDAWMIVVVAPAIVLNGLATIDMSLLNAQQLTVAMARVGVWSAVVGSVATASIVAAWGAPGVSLAILVSSATTWAIARTVASQAMQGTEIRGKADTRVGEALRRLVGYAAPYSASFLVGSGVQMLVPVLILNSLGQEAVGLFRAAWTISSVYLGVLLASMAKDYLPRLVADNAEKRGELEGVVVRQHRVLLLVGGPMVLLLLGLAPAAVPLGYSQEFAGAVGVLNWLVVGEVLRFSSWTAAFVVLSHLGSVTYFLTEFAAGATRLLATWFALQEFGLVGAGIAHVITFLVYQLVVWYVVKLRLGLRLPRDQQLLLAVTICLAAVPLVWPSNGDAWPMTVTLVGTAGAFAVTSYFSFRRAARLGM